MYVVKWIDGTIMEQKAILWSFIKRIVINPPDITLEYTVPLLEENEKGATTETAVLSMLQIGSPCATLFITILFLPQLTANLQYQ